MTAEQVLVWGISGALLIFGAVIGVLDYLQKRRGAKKRAEVRAMLDAVHAQARADLREGKQ
jgi:predicted proteasome-type protease